MRRHAWSRLLLLLVATRLYCGYELLQGGGIQVPELRQDALNVRLATCGLRRVSGVRVRGRRCLMRPAVWRGIGAGSVGLLRWVADVRRPVRLRCQ